MTPQKPYADAGRGYRMRCAPKGGEHRFQVVVEETDLFVVAARDLRGEVADLVHTLRASLKGYITLHPEFLTSLAPVPVPPNGPEIVRAMADASRVCNVGPMASVAGAIAQRVADGLRPASPDILVENGGDVFLHSTRERLVGLLPFPEGDILLGLRLPPSDFPCALCSSSATIGHSLSFGHGDLVVVKAGDGALADAAATALANRIRSSRDLNPVLKEAKKLAGHGVKGVFAQIGDDVGVWGEMELVEI
ncbi:MAG: UPF0280 family protein [Desulfovibrionales bacterium]